ncbi:sensor histidine kinase [Kitasatospora sp. NPDC057015]|uniref:sensor histidine kinase n=1 Tax=Kitasatospora sp. NPDC057015 TaxID=3346001 RepID=UPI00362E28ED
MWPFPMHAGAWVPGVVVVLTALCGVLAVRAERAPARPAGRARPFGWPVVAGLLGMAAYASGSVLLLDLHNPGIDLRNPGTPGYSAIMTVPDLAPDGPLPSALLLAGLLATVLLPSVRAPRRWVLPVVAVVTGELLLWLNASTHGPSWPGLGLLPGGAVVLALATCAGLALGGAASGRPGRVAGVGARRSARWALLLPAVVVMAGSLLGLDPWTAAHPSPGTGPAVTEYQVGLALLVAVTAGLLRWPRLAADLAALGLLVIGAYSIAQGGFGQSLVEVRTFGSPSGHEPLLPMELGHHVAVLGGIQGALLLALGLWLLPRTVLPDARRLLGRELDPALARRVRELTETRAEAVSSAASELRRIERDLHDGAQGRLVAIGMNLRTAEDMIVSSPQEAVALVVEARVASAAALEELRGLVRGIYPPMLADRGLGEAVRALALDLPLPCETEIDLPGRLAAPLESACYFAVAELVTNAVRHASARSLRLRMARADGLLRIEVIDDGVGGADPAAGTGLAGVERRLAAFDGILAVSSPPGGPTVVVLEVPCA